MKFIVATNNEKKLKELNRVLLPLNIEAVTQKSMGIVLEDVEETGKTFEENAYLKAKSACDITNMPAIADDSGLCVDALNGEPGLYSARYAGEHGNDDLNIEKLLLNLKDVPEDKRTAHYETAVCCVFPDGSVITTIGKCYGKIGYEKVGTNGFGYDPIFITESGKTFAQMTSEEKDKISHRGKALRTFVEKLKSKME